jgi:hypothetical protein
MRKLVPSSDANNRTGTVFTETEYLLPFYKNSVRLYSEPYESSPVFFKIHFIIVFSAPKGSFDDFKG